MNTLVWLIAFTGRAGAPDLVVHTHNCVRDYQLLDPQATAQQIDCSAVRDLIEVATSAKNALAIIAASEESDASDKWHQLLFDDLPRLRSALTRVGGDA